MKKLAALFALVALMVTGCATSHQRASYQATAITGASVSAGMAVWKEWVNAGYAKPDQVEAVRLAYNRWAVAYNLVVDIGKATAGDTTAGKEKLQVALDALAAAQGNLLTVLKALLPTDQAARIQDGGL